MLTSIVKGRPEDFHLLAEIGKVSFIESHGSSAPVTELMSYVHAKYNDACCREELINPENIYHFIYYDGNPAGFSKIVLNSALPEIEEPHLTKMDRLYLLNEFYHLHLGSALMEFNIEYSRLNNQQGMWLHVWKDNHRAVRFYNKTGFKIIGSHEFQLTQSHSNPNHLMFLKY